MEGTSRRRFVMKLNYSSFSYVDELVAMLNVELLGFLELIMSMNL